MAILTSAGWEKFSIPDSLLMPSVMLTGGIPNPSDLANTQRFQWGKRPNVALFSVHNKMSLKGGYQFHCCI
jgi:hypothetical protein